MLGRMTRKKSYVPEPEVPETQRERFRVMLAVLAGEMAVAEGARQLGLSRNHFQTLMHRAMSGMLEGMAPKPAGRPATPAAEAALTEENDALRRENARLRDKVETIDRLLGVAGDLLKGRVQLTGRSKRDKPKPPTTTGGSDDEDPERRLQGEEIMRRLGLDAERAAAVVGRGASTLRRWRARRRRGEKMRCRPGPRRARELDTATKTQVAGLVRKLRGLAGATSLARSVPGVSRRQAACIKRETLVEMERERVAGCGRVSVLAPGVIRGFDAMEVRAPDRLYALISADAAVPYRTSAHLADAYDPRSVAAAVERDFAEHGPPLVWRADRAKPHDADDVTKILDRHEVLMLHGPPHHPGYYGQLERQNREHRAWLGRTPYPHRDALECALPEMLAALNADWRRPTLDWRTAEEAWVARPQLTVDRAALRDAVRDKTERITRHQVARGQPTDLATRLAIEQTLVHFGLLRIEPGEWC